MADDKVDKDSKRRSKIRQSPRKISFTEALKQKYCDFDDGLQSGGLVLDIVVRGKPKTNCQAELGFLKNVILSRSNVSHAGIPSNGLADLCPNVVDLDLTNNHLTNWEEILKLLSELQHVKFVNLSGNSLLTSNHQRSLQAWEKPLPKLENLVLNRTGISWADVTALCSHLCALKELHLCDNGYSKIDLYDGGKSMSQLECLRLNENRIQKWDEIWKLHELKNLKSLILSENPLRNIFYPESEETSVDDKEDKEKIINNSSADNNEYESLVSEIEDLLEDIVDNISTTLEEKPEASKASEDKAIHCQNDESKGLFHSNNPDKTTDSPISEDVTKAQPFVSLKTLCVSDTFLTDWEHLFALTKFPGLHAVRLKGIPLIHVGDLSDEERRKLFVACLPNVKQLNGSEVTYTERDKAERHFIRFFKEIPEKPQMYHILEQKHGKLEDLVDIDIGHGYQEWVTLDFLYQGDVLFTEKVHVRKPVKSIRTLISTKTGKYRSFRMQHNPCGVGHNFVCEEEAELQDLCQDLLPMSRYDFMDGDQIIINTDCKLNTPKFNPKDYNHFVNCPQYHIEWASLDFVYCGSVQFNMMTHLGKTVKVLRRIVSNRIRKPIGSFKMLYNPCGDGHHFKYKEEYESRELCQDFLPLSSYNCLNGDQIVITDIGES